MKRYITLIAAGLMLGYGVNSNAQDIHFSQFYENAILRNPALTGIFTEDYKVGVDYRSQWAEISPYNTTMVSAETRILVNREVGDYLSFGLVATFDKAGSINFASQQIYPAIAYNKAIDDEHNSYLSVGLTGGYIARSVDMSLMTFSSQFLDGRFNAANPTGENAAFKSLNNFDVGAGISLNSSLDLNGRDNYYIGASAYHINSPTEIFNGGYVLVKLPIKWQLSAGLHLPLSEKFSLSVQANYSIQRPYSEFIAGGYFTWRSMPPGLPSIFAFSFGAFVRARDAFIPTVRVDYKNISVGFSDDIVNSSLATGAGGASAKEFTLYLKGHYNHKNDPRDPLMCPRNPRFEESVSGF
jgi:type IX secretion system PorP/SprF family membrane protein